MLLCFHQCVCLSVSMSVTLWPCTRYRLNCCIFIKHDRHTTYDKRMNSIVSSPMANVVVRMDAMLSAALVLSFLHFAIYLRRTFSNLAFWKKVQNLLWISRYCRDLLTICIALHVHNVLQESDKDKFKFNLETTNRTFQFAAESLRKLIKHLSINLVIPGLETYFFRNSQTFASGFNLNSQIAVSYSQ